MAVETVHTMPDAGATAGIPGLLMGTLTALRPILVRQGAVQLHDGDDRRPSYRVRYRQEDADLGYAVQRSLPLGDDPNVADAVTQLLASWREDAKAVGRETAEVGRKERLEHKRDRALIGLIVAGDGGGERRRRRAARMYDQAAKDGPFGLFRFITLQDFRRVRRPGRPCRKLW